jgi:TetR/AcrR family transcriptional regulator
MTSVHSRPPKPAVESTTPPPPTSRSAPKRMRRDEIVEEATRLFAERGYEGASMADLAERVGLRKASLFHHFASKDVLYAAVLERLLVPVSDAITRAVMTEGSFPDRLDALSDALTEVLHHNPFAARLLIREAMDWGPVIREKLNETILQVLEGADEFAKAGQAAGAFAELDTRQMIVTVLGTHFMPFAIPKVTEGFLGVCPYDDAFLEPRKEAVRQHVRGVTLRRK